jgi:hypothetical protein
VARGDHPQRTPVYGGALIVAAMSGATAVTMATVPVALRVAVYVVAMMAAVVGVLMTFRDLSQPPRR